MTKDKILSAEEMIDAISSLAQSIFHQEYNGYSNKAAQKIFNFCKELKQQFHPPTMTEEELRKEAEREYPDEIYPRAESWLAERRNWIAQVKILEEQINLTQQERRDIAEKAWIECRNNYRKVEDSSVSEFLTNYLDKHYPLK